MVEILNDWKLYAFLIQGFITIFGFCIIKFNDLRHLENNVSQITDDVKTITTKVTKIDKQLAVQIQRIDTLEYKK